METNLMPFCTFELCENYTMNPNVPYCATHAHLLRKQEKQANEALSMAKVKRSVPKGRKIAPIKKVSEKRAKGLKTYKVLRDAFLSTHYYCQAKLEGCTYRAVDVHHGGGRENEKLNDVSKFIAVCRNCHKICHDKLSAKERRDRGLLK